MSNCHVAACTFNSVVAVVLVVAKTMCLCLRVQEVPQWRLSLHKRDFTQELGFLIDFIMDCVTLLALLQIKLTRVQASALKLQMCSSELTLNGNISQIKNQCYFSV